MRIFGVETKNEMMFPKIIWWILTHKKEFNEFYEQVYELDKIEPTNSAMDMLVGRLAIEQNHSFGRTSWNASIMDVFVELYCKIYCLGKYKKCR